MRLILGPQDLKPEFHRQSTLGIDQAIETDEVCWDKLNEAAQNAVRVVGKGTFCSLDLANERDIFPTRTDTKKHTSPGLKKVCVVAHASMLSQFRDAAAPSSVSLFVSLDTLMKELPRENPDLIILDAATVPASEKSTGFVWQLTRELSMKVTVLPATRHPIAVPNVWTDAGALIITGASMEQLRGQIQALLI